MRLLLTLALLASTCAAQGLTVLGAGNTRWTIIQSKFWDKNSQGTGGGTCVNSGTTCVVNVSSVGAGHVLIGYMWSSNASNGFSSISGETWTHCAACNTTTSLSLDID